MNDVGDVGGRLLGMPRTLFWEFECRVRVLVFVNLNECVDVVGVSCVGLDYDGTSGV